MASNSAAIGWDVGLAVTFAVGLLLYGIGIAIARSAHEERHPKSAAPATAIDWPQLIDETLIDAPDDLRLRMIERLALLETPWSQYVLERATEQESDPALTAAIERAMRP